MSSLAAARSSKNVGRVAVGLLFVAVALLPFLYDSGSPFMDDCVTALAYVVMALGLNIVVGFAGLLDLGYVAFFAIGAYTMGWFASGFFFNANGGEGIHVAVSGFASNLPGIHLNFLLVLVVAIILAALAGVIIGLPTLRLRGDYIAIVTLAFGEIIGRIAINGDDVKIGDYTLTAGRQGISPVDKVDLPFVEPFTSLDLRPWYWTALGMVLVALFVSFRLRDSRLGRAWIALREDEVAAASMGIPLVRTKLMAYGVGAAFGGISGAFLGSYLNTVNADQFAFAFSIFILAMVILGGLGSIWGVVLGAVLLSFINTRLIPDVLNDVPSKVGLDFDLTQLSFGIFGFLLVLMMVLRPEGLIPERRRKMELTEGIGRRRDALRGPRMTESEGNGTLLEAVSVSKVFGGLVAVEDVSFSVPHKSIVSIIGPNGAGKTTFFNMLTGLYKPTVGTISFDGKDVTGKRPDIITSRGMARTFQNIRLFATMSALENVMVSQHSHTKAGLFGSIFRPPWVGKEERKAREKGREMLAYVGLKENVFEEISINLSYGDQRRLEIARALASDPKLLLLDEPTAGMNPQESARLTDFMRKLRDERGLSILLIEHDMKVVMDVSEHITVLDHGEKIAEGEPTEVRNNPRVVEAYLGTKA